MGVSNNVRVVIAVAFLVIVIIVVALWQTSQDEADQSAVPTTTSSPSAQPSLSPSPSPSASEPVIELPNRPKTPATLGLDCGGNYPTVYFRSTTSDGTYVICADSPGASHLTLVSKEKGSTQVRVVKANYAYETDTFVAKDGDLTIRVAGGDGLVTFYEGANKVRSEIAIDVWQFPEYDD